LQALSRCCSSLAVIADIPVPERICADGTGTAKARQAGGL
jgi:hypothetical protein